MNRIKSAEYCRFSSNAQSDGFSIQAQQKAIANFALSNGYDVQYSYIDKARTGTNANRPQFQKMIEDAKAGLFDVIIIHKIDRFSRNRLDSIIYKNELSKYGVKVISVTENFGEGAEAELMLAMQESMAEYYSKNLAREVRKGMDVLSSKGLHTGGSPPLGYDVVDKKLVINEAETEIVRLIFSMYSQKYTYNDMAKELNARGYTTKSGNEFSASSFNSILTQRKYIGEYVYNRRVSKSLTGKYNSHANKPEDEIVRIPNAVPKIIDDETFNKVQARLNQNKRKVGSYKSKSNYLLSGLIVCGECGFHYQGNSRKGGSGTIYSSYRCGKKQNHKIGCGNSEIEKNKLENFVIEQLQNYLFSDEAINEIAHQVNEYNKSIAKTNNEDLILFQKQLKQINKQIANITKAIARGVDENIMIDEINELNQSKKDLQKRIDEAVLEELPTVSKSDIKQALSTFSTYLKENNTIECKRFIDNYIDKIVVHKDKVEIVLKVASSNFNSSASDNDAGALHITIVVSREELQKYPKQRRKLSPAIRLGGNFSISYEIALKNTHFK
ncbi:MAG: recombinase family protein [Eubacterium sp.]|nr:recombinase family protein [Eubacterium sp.]